MGTTGKVSSEDGTSIAYTKVGSGPVLVLVDGAFCHRKFGPNEALAEQLKNDFTVFTYDRRGRGESNDPNPYEVQREVEDLEAIIAVAGGSAYVYGISSGAALALEAADRNVPIRKLALYEAPFVVDGSRPPFPSNYLEHMRTLLADGRRGAVVKYFMTKGVGVPAVFVFMMRLMPSWSKLKQNAHTVIYDTLILGNRGSGKSLEPGSWERATMPTVVICGGKSEKWMKNAMLQLSEVLPNAEHQSLAGQTHIVKPQVLAPALKSFFL